jgi:hypothetical protein
VPNDNSPVQSAVNLAGEVPNDGKQELGIDCDEKTQNKEWDECDIEQYCRMIQRYNESPGKEKTNPSPSHRLTKKKGKELAEKNKWTQEELDAFTDAHNQKNKKWVDDFNELVRYKDVNSDEVKQKFNTECQHKRWVDSGAPIPVNRQRNDPVSKAVLKEGMNPDHIHPVGLGGPCEGVALEEGLMWANADVNQTVGPAMDSHDLANYPNGVKAKASCHCEQFN